MYELWILQGRENFILVSIVLSGAADGRVGIGRSAFTSQNKMFHHRELYFRINITTANNGDNNTFPATAKSIPSGQ